MPAGQYARLELCQRRRPILLPPANSRWCTRAARRLSAVSQDTPQGVEVHGHEGVACDQRPGHSSGRRRRARACDPAWERPPSREDRVGSAPGSNARATSLKLACETIDSVRLDPMRRKNGRMTQRSSGLAYCLNVETSPTTSGSSSGCTQTGQSHTCASSRAEPAWSGWSCVSRIDAGGVSFPNKDSAAS